MVERKTVTIVTCDLVDSTRLAGRLDSETFHDVVTRFYDEATRAMTRHGGTVQEHPGDAVVAAFGVPDLHEDDALRAVMAAVELRAGLVELNGELARTWNVNLELRIGIDTGEVAVDERAVVLGDSVNVAARLQQTAGAGEILIGRRTRERVHQATTLEQVPALLLKGKEVRVDAWRLLSVDPAPYQRGRRFDAPLVGRELELETLHLCHRRAVAERGCHLVVVLGEAGVGKTRLVNEFQAHIGAEATVLKGRCLQYGENLDYWPFVQVIRQAAEIPADDPPEAALTRLSALVRGDETIAVRLAQMLGLREGQGSPEMASWAIGRLIGLLAESKPVVLVIDDLHWAQPTLLSLLLEVADRSWEAPVLLVCIARSEFRHDQPSWSGARPNVTSLSLSPLEQGRIEELIGYLLEGGMLVDEVSRRLTGSALGYPLFAEELVNMLRDRGSLELRQGRWVLSDESLEELATPPSIEALLDTRLESLRPEERAAIGQAAVIGTRFRATELAALASRAPSLPTSSIQSALQSLVRRELVHPVSPAAPGADEYQFRHVLIYEAAYRSLSKETRAALHEAYAAWLEDSIGAEGGQEIERLGRHLKAAYDHRASLGRIDATTADLRRRAGERLAEAGSWAALRGDAPDTAARLLRDAVGLLPEHHPRRLHARLQLADALRETALTASLTRQALDEVAEIYAATIEAARSAGDRSVELHAELGWLEVGWFTDLATLLAADELDLEAAIQELEWQRDDVGLGKAWHIRAYVHAAMGRSTPALAAAEHAVRLAQRAMDVRLEAHSRHLLCFILDWGPTPVDQVARLVSETLDWADRRVIRGVAVDARNILARAEAMRGDFEAARAHIATVKMTPRRSSAPLLWLADEITEATVALLANDLRRAELASRRAFATVRTIDAKGPLPNVAVLLARVMLMQGHDDEAERLALETARIAPEAQVEAQIKQREIRAVVLARRARPGEPDGERRAREASAENLAKAAVELSWHSEQLDSQAQARYDLAEVHGRAGRWDQAAEAALHAQRLWEQKGNRVSALQASRLVDELRKVERTG